MCGLVFFHELTTLPASPAHGNVRSLKLHHGDPVTIKDTDFLDIRRHGFVRVAVAIPTVHVADPDKNLGAHIQVLQQAYDQGAQYVLCPELSLTAYSCADLFHQEILIQAALDALIRLKAHSSTWPDMMFTVGLPLRVDNMLFNCAVTIHDGKILAIAPKAYPPEYREFYELRYFHRGSELHSTEMLLDTESVPIGTDILIQDTNNPLLVLHVDICEDIWVPIPPGTRAALMGATVLANLSASNITIAKDEYRLQLVLGSSARNIAVQLYSAAGFGESSAGLSWDGDGMISERGTLLTRTERFSLNPQVIINDVDLLSCVQERQRQSSFGQNAADNRTPMRRIQFNGSVPRRLRVARQQLFYTFIRKIDPFPAVPNDPEKRDIRCRETFMIQVTALAQRLRTLPKHMQRIFLGVSGGLDSTHAALVAVKALDLVGLPRSRFIGVTMPGFGTTDATYNDACALVRLLGGDLREIQVIDLSELTFQMIGFDVDTMGTKTVTYDNVQAWSRKHVLFSLCSKEGGIVLGTGDLSELLQGWCTYVADHISHYGVNQGVFKTLMQYLIRYVSEVEFKGHQDTQELLNRISRRPYSPELKPPTADGEISQITEDEVGPYELHDFTGYWMLRFGMSPSRIIRMHMHAVESHGVIDPKTKNVYTLETIRAWHLKFLLRFFGSQFKRDVAANGPKVGLVTSDPRGDLRVPSDARPTVWVNDILKNVPDSLPT
jgi:NAD+ synthase (glutamine-hydrolysing)